MTTEQHIIIEEQYIHIFSDEIEHAINNGYTIIASNSFWDFGSNCIRYYALLTKPLYDEHIPLTIDVERPSPMPFDV